MDKKEQARLRKQRQRERDKQRDTTDANVTRGDMSRTDVTLDAVNAYLERKGLPNVRKGVEPMLPFDKKLQASRMRM